MNAQRSVAARIAGTVRRRLLACAESIPAGHQVGVALSGGVDSSCVLAALLTVGHRPTVVSYTPSTTTSTDFTMAQEAAKALRLPFRGAIAVMSPEDLEMAARLVISYGYKGKVEVECLAPMVVVMRAAKEEGLEVLLTGDQADGYFANSKWASHNMERSKGVPKGQRTNVQQDTDPTRIDELRDRYYTLDKSCSQGVKRIGEEMGLSVWTPFRDPTIREAFRGTTWQEVNRPIVKAPLHMAFKLVDSLLLPTRPLPVNLHKGDSYFAEEMGRILLARYPGYRSARGLYSAMARGEV
jgi:asparagine synthetase B (glutamine-hydrolysing)